VNGDVTASVSDSGYWGIESATVESNTQKTSSTLQLNQNRSTLLRLAAFLLCTCFLRAGAAASSFNDDNDDDLLTHLIVSFFFVFPWRWHRYHAFRSAAHCRVVTAITISMDMDYHHTITIVTRHSTAAIATAESVVA